jgi:hypothetical protein
MWRLANVLGLTVNEINEMLVRRATTARWPVGRMEMFPLATGRYLLESSHLLQDL